MICDECDGSGKIKIGEPMIIDGEPMRFNGHIMYFDKWVPCDVCGGTGRVHCCEGDVNND